MNAKEKEQFKKAIIQKIEKTEREIQELEELAQPISPENSIRRVSRMDAINNKSVVEATLRASKKKLAILKFALFRVESADFGVCVVCKNPIPIARLFIMPESTRCVRCADR